MKLLNKANRIEPFIDLSEKPIICEKTSTKFDPIINEDFENYKVQLNKISQTNQIETLNIDGSECITKSDYFSSELLNSIEIEQKIDEFSFQFKKTNICNLLNEEIFYLKCRNMVFRYLDNKGIICENPKKSTTKAIKNSPSKYAKKGSATKNQAMQINVIRNSTNISLETTKLETSSFLFEESITKDSFLPSIKDMSIDNLIDMHSLEYSKVSTELNETFTKIGQKFDGSKVDELRFMENYDDENTTCDLVSLLPVEKKFIEYLEKNRYSNRNQGARTGKNIFEMTKSYFEYRVKPREAKYDDYVCQICSEGDTSEGNVIVFCSRCSITVHQKCYGLETLPPNDWICDLCLAYGKNGKYLRCLACTRKGGALRKTESIGSLPHWKDLNPVVHEMYKNQAINCKRSPKKYQPITSRKRHFENRQLQPVKPIAVQEKSAFDKDLFYNFFTEPDEYPEEELQT